MYQRCYVCQGQKKIKGLGSMIKKCQMCAGTGFIEQVEQDTQNAQNVDAGLDTVKTKRKSHWSKKDA
jgi:DnaJ-class molecular chaperone